jgi:hypothetical protein
MELYIFVTKRYKRSRISVCLLAFIIFVELMTETYCNFYTADKAHQNYISQKIYNIIKFINPPYYRFYAVETFLSFSSLTKILIIVQA